MLSGSTNKIVGGSVLAALALTVLSSAAFAITTGDEEGGVDGPGTISIGPEVPSQTSLDNQPTEKTTDAALAVSSSDLSEKTDAELTQLTAQWNRLSAADRRTLLAEVRGRMVQSRARKTARRDYPNVLSMRPSQGKVRTIRIQRRYGRVVRKPDGTVVVQTRVVQVTPIKAGDKVGRGGGRVVKSSARVTFGVGFEQRSRAIIHRHITQIPTPSVVSSPVKNGGVPDSTSERPISNVGQQNTPTLNP